MDIAGDPEIPGHGTGHREVLDIEFAVSDSMVAGYFTCSPVHIVDGEQDVQLSNC